jgi:serine/threonine-protein kinase
MMAPMQGAEQANIHPGMILADKYRVERVLGVGGMGMVVAATHLHLDQLVALKFMLPQALNIAGGVERFLREARAAVRLKSEHVARVLDVGTMRDGSPYIVMEFLDGMDLATVLQRGGPLPTAVAADYVVQACVALAEAHALGIVHRDIKPPNLFLLRRPDGTVHVKVLDFGIAKAPMPDAAVTSTGMVVGSPAYMSPEQMRSAKNVDARTDIWSLGVILYEALAGHAPFHGESLTELCLHVTLDPVPPLPRMPGVLPGVEAVVRRMLEKDPAQRFATVGEVAEELVRFAPAAAPLLPGIRALLAQRPAQSLSASGSYARPGGSAAGTPLPAPGWPVQSGAAPAAGPGSTEVVNAPAEPARRAGLWIALGLGAVGAVAGVAIAASRSGEARAPGAAVSPPQVAPAGPTVPAVAPVPVPVPVVTSAVPDAPAPPQPAATSAAPATPAPPAGPAPAAPAAASPAPPAASVAPVAAPTRTKSPKPATPEPKPAAKPTKKPANPLDRED